MKPFPTARRPEVEPIKKRPDTIRHNAVYLDQMISMQVGRMKRYRRRDGCVLRRHQCGHWERYMCCCGGWMLCMVPTTIAQGPTAYAQTPSSRSVEDDRNSRCHEASNGLWVWIDKRCSKVVGVHNYEQTVCTRRGQTVNQSARGHDHERH